MKRKIFMLVVFTLLGTTTLLAMGRRLEGALNPILLWEKEFDGVVVDEGVGLARISGDAIVSLKRSGAEQIDKVLIFNTTGQLVQEWKNACYGRISDDGNKVIYLTPYSTDSFYDKVHYATKGGQEIWWKQHGGDAYISPDGNLVIEASTAMESTQLIEVYDATGKEIWSYKITEDLSVIFSPEGSYIGVSGCKTGGSDYKIRVYDENGNLIWKKDNEGILGVISEEAKYAVGSEGLYDKQGSKIFDKGINISGEGNRLIVYNNNRIEIRSLPENVILKTYTIKGVTAISHNGRYVAVIGKRTDITSPNNLFVIDTQTDEIWETKVEPAGKSEFRQKQVFLAKDGKYMLVQTKGKLYYYQLY